MLLRNNNKKGCFIVGAAQTFTTNSKSFSTILVAQIHTDFATFCTQAALRTGYIRIFAHSSQVDLIQTLAKQSKSPPADKPPAHRTSVCNCLCIIKLPSRRVRKTHISDRTLTACWRFFFCRRRPMCGVCVCSASPHPLCSNFRAFMRHTTSPTDKTTAHKTRLIRCVRAHGILLIMPDNSALA